MKPNLKQLLFLLCFLGIRLSSAQTLDLVKDINTGGINHSHPHYLTELNGNIYFVALDGNGHKLYVSDGTAQGTTQIGPSTNPNGVVWHLTKFNGKLFFSYDNGIDGLELWVSDGTAAGTTLLKDINAGAIGSQPEDFTICNNKLFFSAYSNSSKGLWVSDGTSSGTLQIGTVNPILLGTYKGFLTMDNYIYFGNGNELWKSDGTNSNTGAVGNIGGTSSSGSYTVLNNKFYFGKFDNNTGSELWVSDGTLAGTFMLKDINTTGFSSDPQNFFTDGQYIYFEATDDISGRELWVSDGTSAGTMLLQDIAPGAASSHLGSGLFRGTIAYNGKVYFFGNQGSQVNMYETDGTPAGTNLIKSFNNISTVTYSYSYNGQFYFVGSTVSSGAGTEYLFVSDGTGSGTQEINPSINTYSDNPNGFNLLGLNNEIYLPAYFQSLGNEFCKFSSLPLGLAQISNDNADIVFPNPCKEVLTFKTNSMHDIQEKLEIFDVNGKVIKTIYPTLEEENIHIYIGDLIEGVYFLKLGENSFHKIVKN